MEYFKKYFKEVDGREYVALSNGKIYRNYKFDSLGRKVNHIVAQTLHNGYLVCNINGKQYRVHRLIAELFIPNPNNLPQVNHKNGIKTDNSVDNLEWVSAKDNIKHAWENGLSHKRFGKDNDKTKAIVQYDLKGNIIKIWDDPNEIEKKLGFKKSSIQRSISKNYNQSFGYKWGYKEVV